MQSALALADSSKGADLLSRFADWYNKGKEQLEIRTGELMTGAIKPTEFIDAMQKAADEVAQDPDVVKFRARKLVKNRSTKTHKVTRRSVFSCNFVCLCRSIAFALLCLVTKETTMKREERTLIFSFLVIPVSIYALFVLVPYGAAMVVSFTRWRALWLILPLTGSIISSSFITMSSFGRRFRTMALR